MKRALAVIEPKEATKELVAEAGKLAKGVDADLLLLHVTTEEEFADRQNTLREIAGIDSDYTVETAQQGAKHFAHKIGSEVLGDDVAFSSMGRIGNPQDRILETARENDIDHIFIHGKRRSPTGKAVFGDLAQSIILNFDGFVTVTTSRDEE